MTREANDKRIEELMEYTPGELAQQVVWLEDALRPFADLANQVAREAITSPTDATSGLLTINYSDLRRAAEALSK